MPIEFKLFDPSEVQVAHGMVSFNETYQRRMELMTLEIESAQLSEEEDDDAYWVRSVDLQKPGDVPMSEIWVSNKHSKVVFYPENLWRFEGKWIPKKE